ncbi:hypothetical protein K443DRAFT_8130 [Laccaria amethystina LaAM-08-1]|uniref:Uncharacterized protein n=1 Tax=Laccaria amethystina LaAM-08-1 TaxID=1095629 RepID=A0A0C9XV06_9AGAR|nr:hypothetical protein K443DRAFT_8130 [Laccaria amethystina LaAM-08-1]
MSPRPLPRHHPNDANESTNGIRGTANEGRRPCHVPTTNEGNRKHPHKTSVSLLPSRQLTHVTAASAQTTPTRDRAPMSANEDRRPCHICGMGAGELDTPPFKPRGTSLMPRTHTWHGLWGIGQTPKTQRRHDLPTTTTNAQNTMTPPHATQRLDHHTTQTTYSDATTPPCDITTQRRDRNGTRHNDTTTTRQRDTNRTTRTQPNGDTLSPILLYLYW